MNDGHVVCLVEGVGKKVEAPKLVSLLQSYFGLTMGYSKPLEALDEKVDYWHDVAEPHASEWGCCIYAFLIERD